MTTELTRWERLRMSWSGAGGGIVCGGEWDWWRLVLMKKQVTFSWRFQHWVISELDKPKSKSFSRLSGYSKQVDTIKNSIPFITNLKLPWIVACDSAFIAHMISVITVVFNIFWNQRMRRARAYLIRYWAKWSLNRYLYVTHKRSTIEHLL